MTSTQDETAGTTTGRTSKSLSLVPGIVAVAVGLIASGFGSTWSPQVYEFLFGFELIESIDSFMPYFPFVPFYPIFLIVSGAYLITKSRV